MSIDMFQTEVDSSTPQCGGGSNLDIGGGNMSIDSVQSEVDSSAPQCGGGSSLNMAHLDVEISGEEQLVQTKSSQTDQLSLIDACDQSSQTDRTMTTNIVCTQSSQTEDTFYNFWEIKNLRVIALNSIFQLIFRQYSGEGLTVDILKIHWLRHQIYHSV